MLFRSVFSGLDEVDKQAVYGFKLLFSDRVFEHFHDVKTGRVCQSA